MPATTSTAISISVFASPFTAMAGTVAAVGGQVFLEIPFEWVITAAFGVVASLVGELLRRHNNLKKQNEHLLGKINHTNHTLDRIEHRFDEDDRMKRLSSSIQNNQGAK